MGGTGARAGRGRESSALRAWASASWRAIVARLMSKSGRRPGCAAVASAMAAAVLIGTAACLVLAMFHTVMIQNDSSESVQVTCGRTKFGLLSPGSSRTASHAVFGFSALCSVTRLSHERECAAGLRPLAVLLVEIRRDGSVDCSAADF